MISRTLVGLMLVGLLGLASATQHRQGSVCALEGEAQRALVECIREHLDQATLTKLNEVKERFQCEQLYCVFLKICERNNGTLEHSGNEFFTDPEKEALRNAVVTCRDSARH
uniref:Putative microplusin-like antibacteral peptide n=1 Tax=Amblyomma tuberculatum TaxID=48802 RepID=A0A6M2E5V0_9ACAR